MLETIAAIYDQTMSRYGDRPALRSKQNGAWVGMTWKEVDAAVRQLNAAFVELDVRPGDRVALLAENRPEWVLSDLGIILARAVNVPIYPTLTAKQIEYILNDCKASVIIVSTQAQLAKIREIADSVPALNHVVVMDGEAGAIPGKTVLRFSDLREKGRTTSDTHAEELRARKEAIAPGNLVSIIYTSGTTGNPKGVMLTHRNFASNASTVSGLIGFTEEDSCLSFLPLSHVLERVAYYCFLHRGALINYAESIDTVATNLGEVSPTFLVSVPRLFEKIRARVLDNVAQSSSLKKKLFAWGLDRGKRYHEALREGRTPGGLLSLQYKLADRLVFSKVRARTGGKLRYCISGGAPLSKEVGEFFQLIGLTILEGYGLTESSPVITCNRPEKVKIGSVGLPIPGVEVKIAEDGEILARGPNIMLGYFGNEEATREAIDPDGWLHTGDIGKLDSDGFLYITDRKKEILVMSNGKNVAPAPIENALKTSAYVSQALLIGDNRNYVTALVVPNFETLARWALEKGIPGGNEALVSNSQVKELFRQEIDRLTTDFARFEQIKEFTLLPEEFSQEKDELTPTLKFKRRVILAHYAEAIEAMYAGQSVKA